MLPHRVLRFPLTSVSTPAMTIADACRSAALRIMNEGENWNKGHLDAWLATSYGPCFQATQGRWGQDGDFLVANVDPRFVNRMIRAARSQALSTLASIDRGFDACASTPTFAEDALLSGAVARVCDPFGIEAYLPMPGPTTLGDRLIALFAADALARPRHYQAELALCNECELVGFDAISRGRGVCHFHNELRLLAAG